MYFITIFHFSGGHLYDVDAHLSLQQKNVKLGEPATSDIEKLELVRDDRRKVKDVCEDARVQPDVSLLNSAGGQVLFRGVLYRHRDPRLAKENV